MRFEDQYITFSHYKQKIYEKNILKAVGTFRIAKKYISAQTRISEFEQQLLSPPTPKK